MVPHRDLYERAADLPSRWNGDHKRFYTPASLMREIEEALPVNSYRLRHLVDNDFGFDYARAPELSPVGCYEIELVLQKIERPAWSQRLRYTPQMQQAIAQLDGFVASAVSANLSRPGEGGRLLAAMVPELVYFPTWSRLREQFMSEDEEALKQAVRPLLELVRFDVGAYADAYEDLRRAREAGKLSDLQAHWRQSGYFENRIGRRFDPFPPAGR